MNGIPLSKKEIQKIKLLRKTGHSISEITRILRRGKTTVFYHIRNVVTPPPYQDILKSKQGASKKRAEEAWLFSRQRAKSLFKSLDTNTKILIAAVLYWGEGTKRDFSLSNSDPKLIKVFVTCLKEMGIKKHDLRITVRTYEDLNTEIVKRYWAKLIGIQTKAILNVNILKGKKKGKLPYGMCRVRVTRGGLHLKLFKSIVELIAEQLMPS